MRGWTGRAAKDSATARASSARPGLRAAAAGGPDSERVGGEQRNGMRNLVIKSYKEGG